MNNYIFLLFFTIYECLPRSPPVVGSTYVKLLPYNHVVLYKIPVYLTSSPLMALANLALAYVTCFVLGMRLSLDLVPQS